MSFAILTANENENAAVHHFLKLGNPTDTKYRYAKGHAWSDDSFLIQHNTRIKPNEGKSESPTVSLTLKLVKRGRWEFMWHAT